jgi:hypothetical protein
VLLGWHRPHKGTVTIDGRPLDADTLASLREVTAWVDPAVQLWNGSLLDNLRYGNPDAVNLAAALERADLRDVLARLPDGLQTCLGEGGALVSGGEGPARATRPRPAAARAPPRDPRRGPARPRPPHPRGPAGPRARGLARRHPALRHPTTSPPRCASRGCWSSRAAASSRTATRSSCSRAPGTPPARHARRRARPRRHRLGATSPGAASGSTAGELHEEPAAATCPQGQPYRTDSTAPTTTCPPGQPKLKTESTCPPGQPKLKTESTCPPGQPAPEPTP